MALSSRHRRDVAEREAPLAPIQFRLEGREERVTTDDGLELTGRGYLICDARTSAPLGQDDYFFRIGGGIVCDLVDAEQHTSDLQSSAFRPGRSLALVQVATGDLDLLVRMASMGRLHHTIPGTGAVALAVGCALPGSVAARLIGHDPALSRVRLGHPAGVVEVQAEVTTDPGPGTGGWRAHRVTLSRTARRLMEGWVLVPSA